MATPREVLHILPVLRKFRAKELDVRLGCVLRWGQILLTPALLMPSVREDDGETR